MTNPRDGCLVAYHSSVNPATRTGYSIAFVPFQNGKPPGSPRDFPHRLDDGAGQT
ncbi:MAG TPA: hypothetical protein VLY04_23265 [Bryobacteraceae bacterium]|nr:hypothetical protein [Bryobacteraceae bacterium]